MAHWETPDIRLSDDLRQAKVEAINDYLFNASKEYEDYVDRVKAESVEDALRQGYLAIEDGHYKEALGNFFSAIGHDHARYYCLKGIGIGLYHLGKYEEMIQLFDVLLYSTPYDLTIRSYRLKGYDALKRNLIKKSSLKLEDKITLAYCHMTFEEHKKAFSLMDACRSELKPEDRLNLGILSKKVYSEDYSFQQKYFQEALESYKKTDQNPYIAYHYLAVSYFDEVEDTPTEEGFKGMIPLFEESIKHNPLHRENYFYLSHAYKGIEKYDKALNYINKAIDISDERITYYYVCKAYLQYLVDDYNEAIETIVETESYDYEHGDSPYMKMLAGYCYYEMDDLDTAEEWANRARIAGYDIEKVEKLLESINKEREDNAKSNGLFSGIKRFVSNCFSEDE